MMRLNGRAAVLACEVGDGTRLLSPGSEPIGPGHRTLQL
ncbi:hypothetical protein Ae168Ps1_1263c [Pseudonocardia sp. Ae168_Ps1]|nr:hypothetical protein Ae168Ps1_1263c [Pseudonocardia sp. Ae168_Ps1]